MIKRAIFQGEQDQLQHFIDIFYDAQGIKEIPIIEEDMDVVLTVKEDKHEAQFKDWAFSFGLKCTIVETEN